MIIDGFLLFTGTSNGATGGITSGTNTDAPTTGTQVASNIVDIGIGSSSNPAIPTLAQGAGARDLAPGTPLYLSVYVTTVFTVGTSLQIDLAGAPDNGSGGQGSYTVMWTSPTYAEADLDIGAQLSNIRVPRVIPGQTALPRFLRLRFITVGTHTTGAVFGAITLDRMDQIQGTDSALSGYRAGINVAN